MLKGLQLLCRNTSDQVHRENIEHESIFICENCQVSYCLECVYEINEGICKCTNDFDEYNPGEKIIIKKNLNFSYCTQHSDYQAVFYCECNELLCVMCRAHSESHSNHKSHILEDLVKENMSSLKKTKNEIENLKKSIDNIIKKLEEDQKITTEYYKELITQTVNYHGQMSNLIKLVNQESKKIIDEKTLGDLPKLQSNMKRRIVECKKKKDLMEEFKEKIICVPKMRNLIPFMDSKMLSSEYSNFKKEVENHLEYPKGEYNVIDIHELDPSKFKNHYDIKKNLLKDKQQISSDISITGFNLGNFQISQTQKFCLDK